MRKAVNITFRIFTLNIRMKNAVIDFDGNIIEGDFPPAKLKLLVAWIEIHREDLEANWKLLSDGDGFFKIEPLK